MEYKTVVIQYEVREAWMYRIINGLMNYITEIYRVLFEVKVDPIVDQTIVVVQPETSTTATTSTTTTSTTRGTTTLTTTDTQTSSITTGTSWTSVTNPTTTRVIATITGVQTSGCSPTTYTTASTYTSIWTRSTTAQLVGTTSTSAMVTASTSSSSRVSTTNTIVYTTTGSIIGCMEYKTVVTQYEVREAWLERVVSGVMNYITQIYRLVFEIKVDPIVDQTVVVLTPTCTTTTTRVVTLTLGSRVEGCDNIGTVTIGGQVYQLPKISVVPPGSSFQIGFNPPKGCSFVRWEVVSGNVVIGDPNAQTTTITIHSDASIRAISKGTCCAAVGGVVLPTNNLTVLAPYLALLGLVTTGTVVAARRKRKA